MAAKLTVNGITFSDTTQLNSKRGIFPQSTAWIFYQSAAPTGWTKSTSHNNKALRVVSESGGVSGGTNSFTSMMTVSYFNYSGTVSVSTPVGDTGLLNTQIPSHTHTMPVGHYIFSPNNVVSNPDGSFNSWGGGDVSRPPAGTTGSHVTNYPNTGAIGSGTGHNHPVNATAPISVPISLAVQYVDVIVCSFDG
jgi:hypothetical protein